MIPQPPLRASLFITCIVDQLYPEVGQSVARVLQRFGVAIDFPKDQTCCGQPLFNSGFRESSKDLARRVLRSFKESQYVVVPSGSCASMITNLYPQLFCDDPNLAREANILSEKTFEFSQFLTQILQVSDPKSSLHSKVTYHPSCHLLRELGVTDGPTNLIKATQGVEYTELPHAESCCGFGGTFSIKYPHISDAILDDKIDHIAATGAETLVGCDMSCLMHIGGGLSRRNSNIRAMHLAQLLDQAE